MSDTPPGGLPAVLRDLRKLVSSQEENLLAASRNQALRVGCGTAAQFSVFDRLRQAGIPALPASVCSNLACAVCINPVDVVVTRLYNQPRDSSRGQGKWY